MTSNDARSTPLRALTSTDDGGVHVVRDAGSTWLDGSEVELLDRVLTSGLALGSMSGELFATASSWPERYHLSPARANVVRALALPADARVLEIGAGCGAITRYLGEVCAVVDALEPTLARARVAAARTAELPGVSVFCAEVSDVPVEPVYDVVVVVGVLEYVGSGGRSTGPYVEFLSALRAVLAPGGRIVVAIENPVGVKYLAGAPEDHSGEVFHSVEGYPIDGPARTFTRQELRGLAAAAGFTSPQVLGAFPDYKLTRAVFADELFDAAPPLAREIPRFPSPDWVLPRPNVADEAQLWAELIATGHAAEFSNSLVLVAEAGARAEAPEPLWRSGQLAAYFSLDRRPELQVRKDVRIDAGAISIVTVPLGAGTVDGLTVLPGVEAWVSGEGVIGRLLDDRDGLDAVVARWSQLARERIAAGGGSVPFDLLPHNLLFAGEDAHVIDDEWRSTNVPEDQLLSRGALLLARDLAELRGAEAWGAPSRRALAERIAASAGLVVDEAWFYRAVDAEAALQATIGVAAAGERFEAVRASIRADLVEVLARESGAPADRPRVWEQLAHAEAETITMRDLLLATGRQLDSARTELELSRSECATLRTDLDVAMAESKKLRAQTLRARTRQIVNWGVGSLNRARRDA